MIGVSTLATFPAAYSLSSVRLVSLKVDDQSWTARLLTVVRVGLVTVPCTVTARPGWAICGLTELMPIVTCCGAAAVARELAVREVTAAAALPARTGPAAISAANAQASTPRRAMPGHAGRAGLGSRCVGH